MPDENEILESAIRVVEAVLAAPVLDQHKRGVIAGMLWSITEAHGKYKTRFRSGAARAAVRGTQLQHEHVVPRRNIIDGIMREPNRARELLSSALGCVVTVDEHRRLEDATRRNSRLTGWNRYAAAGVPVIDTDTEMMVAATIQKIAILGWGSLLWDKDSTFDEWHGDWRADGPSLKIEFSRISRRRENALTLVSDAEHGSLTTVWWCRSERHVAADAVDDLSRREDCASRHIARLEVDPPDAPLATPDEDTIRNWATIHNLDSVVWTVLKSNFEEGTGRPFTVPNALDHLDGLPPSAKARAAEYISNTLDFVRTPLRAAVPGGNVVPHDADDQLLIAIVEVVMKTCPRPDT